MQSVVCGVDVSLEKLEACILFGEDRVNPLQRSFANSRSGIRRMLAWLKGEQVKLVVMEASGGYERLCKRMVREGGIQVSVVNPARIRHFALGMGELAKTDKIDARVIANFGQVVKLEEIVELSEVELELQELIKRREELQQMVVAERNRLGQAEGRKAQSLRRVIKVLERELELIEEGIKGISGRDEQITRKIELLRKEKGIGFNTAVSLIAYLPELGRVSRKKISALAGVSPFNRESGKWKGKSFITGGRFLVRKILYMSALVATRFNQKLKEYYQRLLAVGKPKKVALVAAMRKLLIICNAILKNA